MRVAIDRDGVRKPRGGGERRQDKKKGGGKRKKEGEKREEKAKVGEEVKEGRCAAGRNGGINHDVVD